MDEQTIKQIWNGFGPDGQNMPYAEFRREMLSLTDQKKIQNDLSDIELLKGRGRTNRIRIDRALH